MPTLAEHRRHYEDYTTAVKDLCTDRGVRRILRDGRGLPVEDCPRLMHRHLTRATAGHGSRRAHYTVAALMALADPLSDVRAAWRNPGSGTPEPPDMPGPAGAAGPAPVLAAAVPAAVQAGPSRNPAADIPAGTAEAGHERYRTAVWRRRPNLGVTLADAVNRTGFHPDRTDAHLHLLLKVGDDQLHRRLPSLIRRVLGEGLAPDWPVLLEDLAQYRFDRNRVALRWQDGFYLSLRPTPKDQM